LKNKQLRFIGILLIIGLIASLTLGLAACGSKATTTSALSSITVSPSSPSNLAVGQTTSFTASGTYSDGSTSDLTYEVSWVSDNTAIASIDANGTATGVAAGTANITASLDGITSSSVSLPVVAATPTLSSIAVTPLSPSILAIDGTQQFDAVGTYADGTTADISNQVTWNSDTTATATISSTGLGSGVAAGTANISATLDGITSPNVLLTVEAVTSIAVAPSSPAKSEVGGAQQFTATATFTDGTTEDITSQVTWASDNTAIAQIDLTGSATGIAAGTANITAAIDGVTSPAVSLTVTAS
jgi:uncharacterized protein YjdB